MEITQQLDLKRFVSTEAKNDVYFKITTWIVAEFNIGKGKWAKVENNHLKINVEGTVPLIGNDFSLIISIEKMNFETVNVELSGSINISSKGSIYKESEDELKIIDLDFDHEGLKDISIISITRWKEVETRVSFYNVSSKLKIKDWLETYWI